MVLNVVDSALKLLLIAKPPGPLGSGVTTRIPLYEVKEDT
jgi:hypothetical protein